MTGEVKHAIGLLVVVLSVLAFSANGQPEAQLLQTITVPAGTVGWDNSTGDHCLGSHEIEYWGYPFEDIDDFRFGRRLDSDGDVLAVASCFSVWIFERDSEALGPRAPWELSGRVATAKYKLFDGTHEGVPESVAVAEKTVIVGFPNAYASSTPAMGVVRVYSKSPESGEWEVVQVLSPAFSSNPNTNRLFGSVITARNGVMSVAGNGVSALGLIFSFDEQTGLWILDDTRNSHITVITSANNHATGITDSYARTMWTNGDKLIQSASRWGHGPAPFVGAFNVRRRDNATGLWEEAFAWPPFYDNTGVRGGSQSGESLLGTDDGVILLKSYLDGALPLNGNGQVRYDLLVDPEDDGTYVVDVMNITTGFYARSYRGWTRIANNLGAMDNTTWVQQVDETTAVVRDRNAMPGLASRGWGVTFTLPPNGDSIQHHLNGPLLFMADPVAGSVSVFEVGCGNGLIDEEYGESCDDGNNIDGDGCDSDCVVESCGNSKVQAGEECDDGNNLSGDLCSDICVVEQCGDGIVSSVLSEECDDGNSLSGDGCSAGCKVEFCGDGIVNNVDEDCDDGPDSLEGDGCTSLCVNETVCVAEECPFPARQVCTSRVNGTCVCLEGFSGDSCSDHPGQSVVGLTMAATSIVSVLAVGVIPMARPIQMNERMAEPAKPDEKKATVAFSEVTASTSSSEKAVDEKEGDAEQALVRRRRRRSSSGSSGKRKKGSLTEGGAPVKDVVGVVSKADGISKSPALARALSNPRRRSGRAPSAASLASAQALASMLSRPQKPVSDPALDEGDTRSARAATSHRGWNVELQARWEKTLSSLVVKYTLPVEIVQLIAFGLDPVVFPWSGGATTAVGFLVGLTHLNGLTGLVFFPVAAVAMIGVLCALLSGFGAKGGKASLGGIATVVAAVVFGAGFIPIVRTLGSVLVCTRPRDANSLPTVVSDPSIVCWSAGTEHWPLVVAGVTGLILYIPISLHWTMNATHRDESQNIRWTRGHLMRLIVTKAVLLTAALAFAPAYGGLIAAAVMAIALLFVAAPLHRAVGGTVCSNRSMQYWGLMGTFAALATAGSALLLSWALDGDQVRTASLVGATMWLALVVGLMGAGLYFSSVVAPTVSTPSEKLLAAHASPWRAWVVAEISLAYDAMDEARHALDFEKAATCKTRWESLKGVLEEVKKVERSKMLAQVELETALGELAPKDEIEVIVERLTEFDTQLDELLLSPQGGIMV